MIVPGMNMAQVRREFDRDEMNVHRAADKQLKELRKSWSFRFNKKLYTVRDYYSKNKNKWLILHHIEGRDAKYLFIIYWYDEKGIKAAFALDGNYLLVLDGHFLLRYNERLKLGIDIPEKRLKHFFLNDDGVYTYDSQPEFNSRHLNVFSIVRDGVALGYKVEAERYVWFKTFVSMDMLYPNQKIKVEALKERALANKLQEQLKKDILMKFDFYNMPQLGMRRAI